MAWESFDKEISSFASWRWPEVHTTGNNWPIDLVFQYVPMIKRSEI
nr:hypothetical protein [Paenibacillus solani]